ncbi:DegT/DnrJ/EryC1/StrS family aminotransferase [Microaerobacter geothermalis]|uniref:DegT/DnrJ/EryC1/StrS family aminotransferase n=1 Tax=Microaerobacter geothermalis TaxID=674972 RepID=UPI001F3D304F|nr:DegT/DnrJ/EryC1/StrS family aminotransferase [Microaerobacter geothermalis]MCF6093309.1 DegT/DnrJ/EryC1/StrS family aminotransferase [Microaerobacter geothermalis]
MIPLIDLKKEYEELKKQIEAAIKGVLESGSFILGEKGKELEKAIANLIGTSYAIGVGNGTDALLLSLEALGIGPGDEIITTPYSFFATAEVIARVGATPVFVDIDPETYNINPDLIEEKISKNTRAIIVVHLFGQAAEMKPIMDIANSYRLQVIEDACQAMGAAYQGKPVGSYGEIACFSFFPSKNLGAYGDGGMVVTNDEALYEKISALRNHGSYKKYVHTCIGLNSRLDEIQAAILQVKMEKLPQWNQKRREIAARYSKNLANLVHTPIIAEGREHIFHQYCIETEFRDELAEFLYQQGIATAIYYPIPLHLQQAFCHLGYRTGDFPAAEQTAKRILALPIYPMLAESQQERVITSIQQYLGGKNETT